MQILLMWFKSFKVKLVLLTLSLGWPLKILRETQQTELTDIFSLASPTMVARIQKLTNGIGQNTLIFGL